MNRPAPVGRAVARPISVPRVKDQYVGDVNDYLKYAMLRAWSHRGIPPGLAWMRTEPDLRSDGGLTGYLQQPELFRSFDPDLFDELSRIVGDGRSIEAVVRARFLAHRFSYEDSLGDSRPARDAWFARLAELADQAPILFLDPDNGLEIASVLRGRAGSRRYVFLDEIATLHHRDRAVCVYQHFPRVERRRYLDTQLQRLGAAWPGARAFALCSGRIGLLVSAPKSLADTLADEASDLVRRAPPGVGAWLHALETDKADV
jgi:hypothetical protein